MPSPAEHTDNLVGRTSPGVVPILHTLDLPVQGMTCVSCAARIEKKLNRMDGVSASVNYATSTAHVAYPAELDPAELVATVERTGYKAELPAPARERDPGRRQRRFSRRRDRSRSRSAPAAPDRGRAALAAGAPARHGAPVALRQLAVGQPCARFTRRRLGRLAVPPRRRRQRPARGDDHGHPDQRRCDRRLPVVALRAAVHADRPDRMGRRRHALRGQRLARALPRGRGRRHRARARRPLRRGPRAAPVGSRVACAAADRRAAGRPAARRPRRDAHRGRGAGRAARRRRPRRRPAGRHRPHRRARRRRAQRRRHLAGHGRTRAGRGRPRCGRGRRHRQHVGACSSCAPPASAPTPRSPGSGGSSRRRRTARLRCNGSPTG